MNAFQIIAARNLCRRMAWKFAKRAQDRDDISQSGFLAIWSYCKRKGVEYNDRIGSTVAWLTMQAERRRSQSHVMLPIPEGYDVAVEPTPIRDSEIVHRMADVLTAKELRVVRLYFGFEGSHSEERIARRFNCHQTRVGQIKNAALAKLRRACK